MNEIWKDVVGYESLYQVSNLGNVKSCKKEIFHFRGGKRTLPEKLRKLVTEKDGYLIVDLYKEGKGKIMKVHRLVAFAFLDLIEGKNQVNHKNVIKKDNRVENLEWCNSSENQKHAFDTGLKVPQINNEISIYMFNKKTNELVMDFQSISKAAKHLKCRNSDISAVLHGRQKSARGHYFKLIN